MKTITTAVTAYAVLAAMVGQAGESAEFQLDTMDGPRTARSVETIAYSTRCEDANVGIANAPFYNLSYFDATSRTIALAGNVRARRWNVI